MLRLGPSPDLIGVTPALGLRDPPGDERAEDDGESGENEIHLTFAELLVDDGEELRDDKRGDPIGGQGPGLRGADGFRVDELRGQDERHGTETEGEGGDEQYHGDGAENRNGVHDAHGEQERTDAHDGDGEQETGFAAEPVDERRAGNGDDDV